MSSRIRSLLYLALCLLTLFGWGFFPSPAHGDGSLLNNGGFDSFTAVTPDKLVPTGWWYFQTWGNPAFDQSPDTAFGAPSLRIWSDGAPFTAGIYQEIPGVTPGVAYRASIGWAASSVPNMERRLGIDPYGGTDPLSPHVIWGPSCWDKTRMPDLSVSAVAQSEKITLYVWVHHAQTYGADQCFLDAVNLIVDPNQPPPTATPTPLPATATFTPPPPTATSLPTDTPSPTPPATATPTATPTWTPTPSATATATPSATASFTPTATPSATSTPSPTATATPTPFLGIGLDMTGDLLLGVGLTAFAGAVLLTSLLAWSFWKRPSK